MEHEDPYGKRHDLQGQRSRSKDYVVSLTNVGPMKSPRNTNNGRKVAYPMYNKANQFQGKKVNDQGHQAD